MQEPQSLLFINTDLLHAQDKVNNFYSLLGHSGSIIKDSNMEKFVIIEKLECSEGKNLITNYLLVKCMNSALPIITDQCLVELKKKEKEE